MLLTRSMTQRELRNGTPHEELFVSLPPRKSPSAPGHWTAPKLLAAGMAMFGVVILDDESGGIKFATPFNTALPTDGWAGALDARLLVQHFMAYMVFGTSIACVIGPNLHGSGRGGSRGGGNSSIGGAVDRSFVQIVRLSSRALVSTTMYAFPPMLLWTTRGSWNPWTGGDWCTPMSGAESWLLQMQLMYYVFDTPFTVWVGDKEQIIHHSIGIFLVLPSLLSSGCGVPTVAGLWCLQGSTILTRYIKLLRYALPKHTPLEKMLVFLNYVQCFYLFLPLVATPLLLNVIYQCLTTRPFPHVALDAICAIACAAQLAYEWYWNLRLRKAWTSYRTRTVDVPMCCCGC